MNPQAYCQDKAVRPGSSLYYSLLPLPMQQRRVLTALYAFVREVMEIAEANPDTPVAQAKLNWWREEVGRLFEGQAQHPVTQALTPHVAVYALQAHDFWEIIEGAAMTLQYPAYPSFRELALYCHRLGSMPLALSTKIGGHVEGGTLPFTHELGVFLLLLRILRRVRQDARRGRCYIPLDEMRQFGVDYEDLSQGRTTEAMRALFRRQAERMRDRCRRAFAALPDADRWGQRHAILLAELAGAVLDEIEADGFRVTEHYVALTPLRKLWITWRVNRRERRYRAAAEPVPKAPA